MAGSRGHPCIVTAGSVKSLFDFMEQNMQLTPEPKTKPKTKPSGNLSDDPIARAEQFGNEAAHEALMIARPLFCSDKPMMKMKTNGKEANDKPKKKIAPNDDKEAKAKARPKENPKKPKVPFDHGITPKTNLYDELYRCKMNLDHNHFADDEKSDDEPKKKKMKTGHDDKTKSKI